MLYAVRWEGKVIPFMNIVKLTGISINSNHRISWRLLLQNALELISIAEKYEGKLITSQPPKRNGEFVYFEVIFKNNTDCESFLKAMRNKSS